MAMAWVPLLADIVLIMVEKLPNQSDTTRCLTKNALYRLVTVLSLGDSKPDVGNYTQVHLPRDKNY